MIPQKFAGKGVFITGVTGFLGKVILEKLLRSTPDVRKIYILIRQKKDATPHQRLERLIQSRIFNRLRSERSDFEEFALGKLHVISGDVSRENVGMSDEDIRLVQDNVNIIIHSAATVNFTEPLPEALNLNVLGSLRLLAIAKGCKQMDCFTHISTAFVNCDKRGQVDEILYPLDFDPNRTLQELLEMDPAQMLRIEDKLFSGFPNSYTFTKSITEHLLAERRENVPLLIFRPTIIGAAYKEPTPGWLDTVSAASALYVTAGMGIMKFMLAHRPSQIGDQVPADIVSNALIAATADLCGENRMNIIQVGTSKNKPLTWRHVKKTILPYLLRRPPKRTFSKPSFMFVTSDAVYNSLYFFQYRVPIASYNLYARFLGTEKQLKEAQLWGSFEKRVRKMVGNFHYFVNNEWIFDTTNTYEVWNKLSEEDQLEFPFDISQIDWEEYLFAFCYGMKLNILRETDTIYPLEDRNCPMYLRRDLGADFWWAFSGGQGVNDMYKLNPPEKMKPLVLRAPRVQEEILKEAQAEGLDVAQVEERARDLIDIMAGTVNMGLLRTEGYFYRKFYRYMYQGIFVDEFGIKRVAEAAKKGPILLLPTHRSYLDFLLTSFVFYDHDLPVPRIASGDDFLNMTLVSWILRHSGAFFMRRSYGRDELYRAIFAEYVQQIIQYGHPLEFFIEGTRSRSGKTLPPKFGLLSVIINALLEGGIDHVSICPITLSYERVVEEQSHAHELAGQPKVKPTTTALVQAAFGKLIHENYGRINMQFAEPIEINAYLRHYKEQKVSAQGVKDFDFAANREDLFEVVESLGHSVVESFHREMVVMSTHIFAAVLMAFRGGIGKDSLAEKFGWFREQLIERGCRVDPIEGSNEEIIAHCTALMKGLFTEKRNIVEVEVVPGQKNIHLLQLSMYRNGVLHCIQREGILAVSLMSFGKKRFQEEGVSLDELIPVHHYLSELFVDEFVDRFRSRDVHDTLEKMQKFGLISIEKRGKTTLIRQVPPKTVDDMFDLLCESFWPFVESYWLAATTLFSLQNKRPEVNERMLIERVQWFGEKCYFENSVTYFDATCKESIRTALKIFNSRDVITTNESSSIILTPAFAKHPEKLQDLVSKIGQYRKMATIQPHVRLEVQDFPALAKL